MEECESVQFWIVSRQDDPGRIEVPVDAGSDIIDIIRPIYDDPYDDMRDPEGHMGKDVFCESPVDITDLNHYRSISTSTVSSVPQSHSISEETCVPLVENLALSRDQDWNMSSSDLGCVSGRSFDSGLDESLAESIVDTFTLIDEFDSLVKGSLPDICVRRAFRGRQSLLQEFDFGGPPVPHKDGVDRKGFGFVYQGNGGKGTANESSTLGKVMPKFSGFGDLRRRITRFMSSKSGKRPASDSGQSDTNTQMPPPACRIEREYEAIDMEMYDSPVGGVVVSRDGNGMAVETDERTTRPTLSSQTRGTREEEEEERSLDFLLLIPK